MPNASRRNRRSSRPAPLIVPIEDDAPRPSTSTSGDTAQRTVALPRELQPHPYREVSEAALTALGVNLTDMPVVFLQDVFREIGDSLLLATNGRITTSTTGPIPREVEMTLPDDADVHNPPTHVLAVHASTPADQTALVTLYPVHGVVLVMHCANLTLPHERPRRLVLGAHSANLPLPPAGARRLVIPVHPLLLPSPSTFQLLLEYLYTGHTDPLLAAFLPPNTGTRPSHACLRGVVDTCTIVGLLEYAYTVQGVWSNVGALGVFDSTLWDFMHCVWGTLLAALEMKIEEQ